MNNLDILGKKSVSAKFKASIMPSGGSPKVKPGLPSTFFLDSDAPCISPDTIFVFYPKNYTIVSILNENVPLNLSFRYDIFLIKSSL